MAPAPRRTNAKARPAPRQTGSDKDGDKDGDKDEQEDGAKGLGQPNYITPAGYKKLVEEFDFLRAKKRPEVVNALGDAAAEGDRSENAEYIYRKRQLRQIDSRLRFLSKRLDYIEVVDPQQQKRRDRVFFGATVTVEDEDGEVLVYRIMGQDEIGTGTNAISWKSPVGRALLGKTIGDTVTVRLEAGTRELTIAAVAYE